MTYKLNGFNYTEMLLTDEEFSVVKAMRKGAKVSVDLNDSNESNELDKQMDCLLGLKKD